MTPNVGEAESRRRRTRRRVNAVALGLFVSALPGVAHASQSNRPPESPSTPIAGHVDQSPTKQRAKRLHGHSGPKIPAPAIVRSRQPILVENRTAQKNTRGSARGSGVHHIYSRDNKRTAKKESYRQFNPQVTLAQQKAILGKPVVETHRKDEKEKTTGVFKLLSLLEQVSKSEAQMLKDTLVKVINGRIPDLSIESIQQQAIETLNASIIRIVQKASPVDLAHLAALDFSEVKSLKLSKLTKLTDNISPEQIQRAHAVIDQINEGIQLNQSPDSIVDRLKKDWSPAIPVGLVLASLIAITADALRRKDVRKINGLLAISIMLTACGVSTTPIVNPTSPQAVDTEPAPTQPATEIPTPTEVLFPNIIITPAPIENSVPSDILGLNIVTGAIPGIVFTQNNPGYTIIQPPLQAYEVPITKYVDTEAGNAYKGSTIQIAYLMALFDTPETPAKDGLFHGSWNGQPVTFTGDFKFLVTPGGQKIPLGLPGNWGFTVLFEKDGTLFLGSTDGNYLLQPFMIPLVGASENEITQSLKEFLSFIAGNSGGIDQTIMNRVADLKLTDQGYLILLDEQGNELAYLDYFGEAPLFLTPTALPTLTETPVIPSVPMIEVVDAQGNKIQIPDPKASNPEFFDITNPDSPIVQFANAFGIKPEEVGNLTPQLETGIDGKQFVVLTISDLAVTSSFDETGTPLFIAEQGENGVWGWTEAGGSIISNRRGLERGVLLEWYRAEKDPKYLETITKDYNHISLNTEFVWKYLRPNGNKLDEYDLNKINQALKFAQTNNLTVDLEGLIWGLRGQLPDWLVNGNFTKDELTEIMTNHIKEILTMYKGKFERVNIISEPFGNKWEGSFWSDKLGLDNHVQTAFRTAYDIDPDATFTIVDINDSDQLFNLVERLNEQEQLTNNRKLIDAVGWEMPFFLPGSNINVNDYLDPQKRASTLEKFRKNIERYHQIGVEVYITELLVDMTDIPGTPQQKLIFQAELYKEIQEICIEEGVPITTYSFYDDPSIYPQGAGRPHAAPYPRDQEYLPKASYYSLLDALLHTPLSPPE